jgi:Co/Zn/Cd efflux system component
MPASAAPADPLTADDRRRLRLLAMISFAVFALELLGGELAESQAVQADALGFAATGFAALAVLNPVPREAFVRSGAALAIAAGLTGLAGWIGITTLYRFFVQETPEPSLMAALGVAALAGNGTMLYLLRARRAVPPLAPFWLRARDDSIGGATLVVAAGVVVLLQNSVADLTVAGVMIVSILGSLVPELRGAWRAWRVSRVPPSERESR